MTAPTKTEQTLLAWQQLATGNVAVGSSIDVSAVHAIGVLIQVGRNDATAHATPWAVVELQGSPDTADDTTWGPIVAPLIVPAGSSIASTTLNGAVSAGATSFVVTSASNIQVADILFLGHTTDPTKYELVTVKTLSGTTITPTTPVRNGHDTGAVVTDQAEIFYVPSVELAGVQRVRVHVRNSSGRTINVSAFGTTVVY